MAEKLISSKEVVEKFGISYPMLTHYTNIGLLHMVAKRGNRRLYDPEEIKSRIPKIKEMVNEGYSLRLVVKQLNQD